MLLVPEQNNSMAQHAQWVLVLTSGRWTRRLKYRLTGLGIPYTAPQQRVALATRDYTP